MCMKVKTGQGCGKVQLVWALACSWFVFERNKVMVILPIGGIGMFLDRLGRSNKINPFHLV